ncbi:MAG TPA: HD-GYP domain-containing protein [Rhodocyclaceae bacterium]|nr:HD-GYP domain-containing protein [Rhodocyclaceae bacterium]
MVKKISIDQLKPGMYVSDLNCGWLDHPFLTNTFAVRSDTTVEKIRALGVKELYIDPERGDDVESAPTKQEVSRDLENRLLQIAEKKVEHPPAVRLAEESPRAKRLHIEANRIVKNLMDNVRLGQQIELEKLEPMVENMVDSIFRNQNALLPLARLKHHDTYTFEHSVSVCALMVAFSRGMKLSQETIREIGMGALLHDVGKARIPDAILNKPAKLTDEEFAKMKNHVAQSVILLEHSPGISETALLVAGQHHERHDGTGYPNKLKGEEISLYGRMASVVDVYDAISSDRVYHKGMPPPEALKKLLEWSDHHFEPILVHSFIRAIGIYPTGTLVRLASDRLAVVTEQNEGNLLEPVVRVIYDVAAQHYVEPEIVDLAHSQDRVVAFESHEKWKIDPYRWLPA